MLNFLNLFWSKNNPIPLYQTLAPLKEEFMSVPQKKYAITVSLLRGLNEARRINQSVIDMFEGVPVND